MDETDKVGWIDLHTHSCFSDGACTPEDLVEEAVWRGLVAIALTDHDSIDGNARALAAGQSFGIEVVPGVELSCEYEGRECHIVGLFLEPTEQFHAALQQMRQHRRTRMQEMLQRLAAMDIHIEMDEMELEAEQSFGRPHLAQVMVKRGIVRSINEAFARYLGDTGPINIPKERFTLEEGLRLIREAHGISVLAHPDKSGLVDEIPRFAMMGLQAAEVTHATIDNSTELRLRGICRNYKLDVSGGSDFHRRGDGPPLGTPQIPYSVLKTLKERKDAIWPSGS